MNEEEEEKGKSLKNSSSSKFSGYIETTFDFNIFILHHT